MLLLKEISISPSYAFPMDLIPAIKAGWNAPPAGQGFDLPDDQTLQCVLETCYHASLRTTEQRPVRCVVAYAPFELMPSETLLLFERPVELSDDQIVRLAPVTNIRRTLMGCDHVDGQLRIWGLLEHGYAWVQYTAGDPTDTPLEETDLPPDCLMITIEGAGTLSVSQGRRGLLRLREGQIVVPQKNPMRDVDDPLGRFFCHLVDDLRNSPPYRDRLAVVDECDERSLRGVYTTSLTAILDCIRLRKEGGSLVIVRSSLDAALAQITYTVAEHTGLTVAIVNYYESLRKLLRAPGFPPETTGELEKCRAQAALRLTSQKLFRGMNQISLLACVDGAVLLDDHLQIQGFGVRFSMLLPVGTTVLNVATGVEHPCDQWGLRHQSIFSVCQKCEQAVGLIVSHDGGGKAVKSVDGKLHFWDNIFD